MNARKAPSLVLFAAIGLCAAAARNSFCAETVRESGRFHCDLETFQRLPALLLIGENHCSASSLKVKADLAARGAKGEIFAAFEVADLRAVYPWNADFILGLRVHEWVTKT